MLVHAVTVAAIPSAGDIVSCSKPSAAANQNVLIE
jgi:hypothetical protein